jgi:hypothetical protein
MQTLEQAPQVAPSADETLRMIERRLDSLSELIEGEHPVPRAQVLSLAGYRRDVAKQVDQIMTETHDWWHPTSA